MAVSDLNIGPTGRNPDYANGEYQYAFIETDGGGGTVSLVDAGGGVLQAIQIHTAPTDLELHDAALGATLSDDTIIVDLATAVNKDSRMPYAFSVGLQVAITGATRLTIAFRGAPTVNTLWQNPGHN